jgi:hypothetical protein
MTITRADAREVTTAAEQELVEESFHPAVRTFDAKALKQRIVRARRMRDKYADLSRQQGIASKRRGRGGEGENARSKLKARLFAETLQRLEKRLEIVTEAEATDPGS